jgi:excisionase family DNA binding protein
MAERWPALLTKDECCEYLGVGRTKLAELRAMGLVRSVRVGDMGNLLRFRRADLDRFVEELEEARGEPVVAGNGNTGLRGA